MLCLYTATGDSIMDDIRHSIPPKPVRFLDQLRLHIRESGLAYRTEQTYIHWARGQRFP